MLILYITIKIIDIVNKIPRLGVFGWCGGSGRVMCEWLVGQWIEGVISFQKIIWFVWSKRMIKGRMSQLRQIIECEDNA